MIKLMLIIAFAAGAISTTPLQSSGGDPIEDNLTQWMEKQEVSIDVPFVDTRITLGARKLQNDEIDMKVRLSKDNKGQARKSKLKKIFAPILILVIIKAITLIPLALGLLGLKTWNAIQLSFVTFVATLALAVYEMCKKVAVDHPIVSHSAAAWSSAKTFNGAQDLAYSAYTSAEE